MLSHGHQVRAKFKREWTTLMRLVFIGIICRSYFRSSHILSSCVFNFWIVMLMSWWAKSCGSKRSGANPSMAAWRVAWLCNLVLLTTCARSCFAICNCLLSSCWLRALSSSLRFWRFISTCSRYCLQTIWLGLLWEMKSGKRIPCLSLFIKSRFLRSVSNMRGLLNVLIVSWVKSPSTFQLRLSQMTDGKASIWISKSVAVLDCLTNILNARTGNNISISWNSQFLNLSTITHWTFAWWGLGNSCRLAIHF